MRLLGIDYGLKRIGLAIANENLAQPFRVIDNDSRLLEKLVEICQLNQIEKIVIGLPEGKIAKKVRKFGKEISQATKIPIDFQDETLTSKEAVAKMIEAGKGKKYRQTKSDTFAAAIILQNYLDSYV